jgi:hypothetical protein
LIPRINPGACTIKKFLVIKIKDNRQGMSSEVKPEIFDYLFTTKKVGKDTGLGLSISRQIVEETHGCKHSCFRACWEKVRNWRSPCRFDKIYSPPLANQSLPIV